MIAALPVKRAISASGTNAAVMTHGTIALRNLAAQIEGLERNSRPGLPRVEERVRLIDLLALRGSILGSIADYERALELAHLLVRDATTEAAAFLARARTRAVFHRFGEALEDLDVAERLAASSFAVNVGSSGSGPTRASRYGWSSPGSSSSHVPNRRTSR